MTDKPSREDVLRVAGEPTDAIYDAWHGAGVDIAGGNWTRFSERLPKLYTEAQALAMYAAGAEDMRERAAKACEVMANIGGFGGWSMASAIRSLPITPTNTEGEQRERF